MLEGQKTFLTLISMHFDERSRRMTNGPFPKFSWISPLFEETPRATLVFHEGFTCIVSDRVGETHIHDEEWLTLTKRFKKLEISEIILMCTQPSLRVSFWDVTLHLMKALRDIASIKASLVPRLSCSDVRAKSGKEWVMPSQWRHRWQLGLTEPRTPGD